MSQSARAHISKSTLEEVLHGARNNEGEICCWHCKSPITDDQMLTIQHHVPRRALSLDAYTKPESFGALARTLKMDEGEISRLSADDEGLEKERYDRLRELLNAADNLSPMHNACHHEVDFGMHYSPEKAAEINRKPPSQAVERPTFLVTEITHQGAARLASDMITSHRNALRPLLRAADDETLIACHEQLSRELEHFQEEDYVPKAERERRMETGTDPATEIAYRLSYLETYLQQKAAKAARVSEKS